MEFFTFVYLILKQKTVICYVVDIFIVIVEMFVLFLLTLEVAFVDDYLDNLNNVVNQRFVNEKSLEDI